MQAPLISSFKDRLILFAKLTLTFALLYDINFVFIPGITSARIVFVCLLMLSIRRQYFFSKAQILFLTALFFVFIVSLIQYIYSSDLTQSSRLLWFAIYGVITPFLLERYFRSRNEFLKILSSSVILQALLSILSFISPPIKALFYNLIVFTSNFDETETIRATGFASIGGAGLSVIQSAGVISILLLLKLNHFNLKKTLLLWCGILVIVVSTFVIGRTGLLISILAIGIYFLSLRFQTKYIATALLILFILYKISFVAILEKLTSDVEGFNVELFTNWIGNAFNLENNDTADNLSSMPIPPISLKTILGTGRVVDQSGEGNASQNDSGYIQTYYSLGLFVAFFFYSSYLIFLLQQVRKQGRTLLYILVLIIFTIEIKEPFIFHYMFPCFVLSTILLINKEWNNLDICQN